MRDQALNSADPPLKPGGRVLVHGGAGGVGHLAVQLAKVHWKAYVVTTAGPKNVGFIRKARPSAPAAVCRLSMPHSCHLRSKLPPLPCVHAALRCQHCMSPRALHPLMLHADASCCVHQGFMVHVIS
jgi:hypothetical protein